MVQPVVSRTPEMWLLSTSERTGRLAGELGLGFTVGTFLLPNQRMIDGTKRSVAAYRSEFELNSNAFLQYRLREITNQPTVIKSA